MNPTAGIPSLSDLRKYSVNRTGEAEVVKQTLYDFIEYPAAGASSLTFFQSPVGSGGRTLADTNMRAAGQLPVPINFLVTGIEIHFLPGVSIAGQSVGEAPDYIEDVQAFYQSEAWLNLLIGSKEYLQESPLYRFPPQARLSVSAAVALTTAGTETLVNYANASGKPYFLTPPLLLVSQQNFSVTLNWPAVAALPSTVAGRVGVVLDGLLYRESQ